MDKCPHLLPLERAPMSILDRLHHSLPFQSHCTFQMVMYCLLSALQDVILLVIWTGFFTLQEDIGDEYEAIFRGTDKASGGLV